MLAEACTCTSEQCEENLAANSAAACKFIEDVELSDYLWLIKSIVCGFKFNKSFYEDFVIYVS